MCQKLRPNRSRDDRHQLPDHGSDVCRLCHIFFSGDLSASCEVVPDAHVRLAFLGIGVLVNLDYHYMKHALGWADGYSYRSLLPYTSILNYLIACGFVFCILATMFSQVSGRGSKEWVQWSHCLSIVYLAACFISADFTDSGSYNADPYFVGVGPIFWFTMVLDSNEHLVYLTGPQFPGNYMVPFSVALFVWKAVVAFLYNNTWQAPVPSLFSMLQDSLCRPVHGYEYRHEYRTVHRRVYSV